MAVLLYIVAQNGAISGGAGWVGTGLLGTVLCWLLLKHLPDKDKHIASIIHEHTDTEKEQRAVHSALEREQRTDFQQTLQAMMEHSRKQFSELALALREDLDRQQKVLDSLTHAINSLEKSVKGVK